MATLTKEDWIKVEDRLPEDGGMQVSDLVLVRIVDDNPRAVSKAYPAIGYCLLDTGEWRSHDDREIIPTHWMPIILPDE